MKTTLAAAVLAGMLGVTAGIAQVAIEPPPAGQGANANSIAPPQTPATPATPPAQPAAQPRGAAAATLPSAASVLEGLLNDKQSTSAVTSTAPSNPDVVQQRDAVAPNEPAARRLREGQVIYERVGRLVKDDKSGATLFIFDSDGKEMYDPPMGVVSCHYLEVMEDMSDNGAKPVKFKVSGTVTQYRGKNFLFPTFAQAVRDLNQGLGG